MTHTPSAAPSTWAIERGKIDAAHTNIERSGGYGFYLDDKVTAETGQEVATHATNYETFTVNGGGFILEENPIELANPMYNVTSGKIIPIKLSDMLKVSILFTASGYGGQSPYLEFQMDVGGTAGAFIHRSKGLLKNGDDFIDDVEFSAFVGTDFFGNGGLLQVRYDGTGSVKLFNKAIQVQRTYSAV